MRITQVYLSKSVSDFPVMSSFNLQQYYDSSLPCLFFGMYRDEDFKALISHSGIAVVMWCGHDAITFKDWGLIKFSNIYHTTAFPRVAEYISNKGIKCKIHKPGDFREIKPIKSNGKKVYAYCPKSFPSYHGSDILKKLNIPHEIIIGDGSFTQEEWRDGKADEIYENCFIGLFLSSLAGGGAGIIEMGLRGKRVVTNVIQMPHTISWRTISEIEAAIISESRFIQSSNHPLAIFVKKSLDSNLNFLYTEIYE